MAQELLNLPKLQDYTGKQGRYIVTSGKSEVTSEGSTAERKPWLEFRTPALSLDIIKQLTTIQLFTESRDEPLADHPDAGYWTWFELRICEKKGGTDGKPVEYVTREHSNGQLLEWCSHNNRCLSEHAEWCRGRLFTKDDDMLKLLKEGDIIQVYISACFKVKNYAESGCLVFGLGSPEFYPNHLRPPPPPELPAIQVYGQNRRERLMLPIDGSSRKTAILNGGVDLLCKLLKSQDEAWTVDYRSLGTENCKEDSPDVHAVIELDKVKVKDKDKGKPQTGALFRAVHQYTCGKSTPTNADDSARDDPSPKIIIWDETGVHKQSTASSAADLLIYQMRAPLWEGNLWAGYKANKWTPRSVLIIDADDLRARGFFISRGLSWEKTMEDFYAYLPELVKELPEATHLLVRCGYEGVFYVPANQAGKKLNFVCYMVSDKAEGDLLRLHDGRMPGIDQAFIAGLAASLVRESETSLSSLGRNQIGAALKQGLIWSQRFASVGFREDRNGQLNYPDVTDLDLYTLPQTNLIYADVLDMVTNVTSKTLDGKPPVGELIESRIVGTERIDSLFIEGKWSLFTLVERFEMQFICDLVRLESKKWLEASVPTARFGNLHTADRTEIECFRSTAAVVDEYLRGKMTKPLSIAVFGQPGAGKSFGATEVIKAVLDDCGEDYQVEETNLSQFLEHSDLVAVFHKIRDISLQGKVPVILFDEFDALFNRQPLGWLKYFLAPMQDGQFVESGHTRPLGRAIFVFIGGTSSTFEEFRDGAGSGPAVGDLVEENIISVIGELWRGSNNRDANSKEATKRENDKKKLKDKQAKKPDFVSRLSAYIDVKGPNKSGDNDKMVAYRRAIILRGILERRLKLQKKDIYVEDRLLRALLKHDNIRHGARSLTLIAQMSRLTGRQRLEASALPSEHQLGMHLDVEQFRKTMRPQPPGEALPLAEQEPLRQIDATLRLKMMWASIGV